MTTFSAPSTLESSSTRSVPSSHVVPMRLPVSEKTSLAGVSPGNMAMTRLMWSRVGWAADGRRSHSTRASDPQYLTKNVLNRQFCAKKPNEKWLTDVTEFKY